VYINTTQINLSFVSQAACCLKYYARAKGLSYACTHAPGGSTDFQLVNLPVCIYLENSAQVFCEWRTTVNVMSWHGDIYLVALTLITEQTCRSTNLDVSVAALQAQTGQEYVINTSTG